MPPSDRPERHRKLVHEKSLVTTNFPKFHCRISGLRLTCRGWIQPSDASSLYRVEIIYAPWSSPDVRVLRPEIQPNAEIHTYRNGTLCLFDWRTQPWEHNWHLHQTVIPWTAEWLLYYELYLLTGKWLGRAAPHEPSKAGPAASVVRE